VCKLAAIYTHTHTANAVPELAMTMLACARIGAIHSVVFAGFSADALAARVAAARSKVIVTADVGVRGGKTIPLHDIVTQARTKHGVEDLLTAVLVWERFYDDNVAATAAAAVMDDADDNDGTATKPVPYVMQPKDVRMNVLVAAQRPYSVPVWMDAEDALFLLYTSGSTGQPKGLVHTTGGYALYAAFTAQTTFDVRPDKDVFACVADCGWITGHTYVVYGPLLNGATTFLFESTPVYPNPGRYWDMIQRHQITQFYTAPTAIRLLMRYGDEIPSQYDTSSVRVLGTVGEPINPEAWRWYYEVVGKTKCSVVDTYWQTETGGHVITNLPGVTPMKPGSCTLPMYGIQTVILDAVSGQPVTQRDEKGNKKGVLAIQHPWPGMARTCLGDHERYLLTYFQVYPGYYFTGDSAVQDSDGYTFIIGRVDDVLNVSGHRIGTAEVESALVAHALVAQAAVVGQPHEIKGQSIAAFVMLTSDATESAQLVSELRQLVRQDIGSFATPDLIVVAPTLPMTRSGKIMRRILRKIVCDETDQLGDTSTLADPSIVEILIEKVAAMKK
jgi:acetyl-CoA synthetase